MSSSNSRLMTFEELEKGDNSKLYEPYDKDKNYIDIIKLQTESNPEPEPPSNPENNEESSIFRQIDKEPVDQKQNKIKSQNQPETNSQTNEPDINRRDDKEKDEYVSNKSMTTTSVRAEIKKAEYSQKTKRCLVNDIVAETTTEPIKRFHFFLDNQDIDKPDYEQFVRDCMSKNPKYRICHFECFVDQCLKKVICDDFVRFI